MCRSRTESFLTLIVFCLVGVISALPARADEVWIAPTSQQDVGGLGIASNFVWPVTPIGAVRFAWGIPENMDAFQGAKIVLIPHAPGGVANLNIIVCAAQNGQSAAGSCSGPIAHPFVGVVNNVTEVDITATLAPKVGGFGSAGLNNLAVVAYTSPTTTSDHIVGLRFVHRGKAYADLNSRNTVLGFRALPSGTGQGNTALGFVAMRLGASGNMNTAVGDRSMSEQAISGSGNTALGGNALQQISSGSNNTAIGIGALLETHGASDNTAVGANANAAGGNFTTAVGSGALAGGDGFHNTATGYQAAFMGLGDRNSALGAFALGGSTLSAHPNDNVAIGYRAGFNIIQGDHNIDIANEGLEESNTLRLGTAFDAGAGSGQNRAFIAGIRSVTTGFADAIPVVIDSLGQLGTVSSSRRFKEDIHDMGDISSRLFHLRPVSFRYSQAYADGSKPLQYGLVAEEVAEVFPELAVRDASGQVETVHYETLNVLLLNELQHQEQRIEALERRISELMTAFEERR